MKVVVLGTALAGLWLVAGNMPSDRHVASGTKSGNLPVHAVVPASDPAVSPAALTDVVQHYCVVCHNDAMLTGNITFQSFSVEKANEKPEIAERMIRKLRAGMMPPPGAPRPSPDTLQALVETLENTVDQAAASAPHPGVRRFARLNRAEYDRSVKDLLDLDVDASKWLPPDVLSGAFDNMSASQLLTPTLLDAYLRAATDVSLLALGDPKAVSVSTYYKNRQEVSQNAWDHVDGTPFGTRGGMVVKHDFPADGQYVLTINTRFGSGLAKEIADQDIDVSIDGESVATLMLPHNGGGGGRGGGGGEEGGGGMQTDPIKVTAGEHQISVAFVNLIDGSYTDRFVPPQWSAAGGTGDGYGLTGLPHLTGVGITGPDKVTGVSDNASRRKVLVCKPASADKARPCAEKILSGIATQAYRQPVTPEQMAALMKFYDAAAKDGFETGIRAGLQAILAAPEFVFRLERQPESVKAGQSYRLSDVDLASRLSFFLWATVPDQELMQVAEKGKLSNPVELEKQVRRMLADPRSEALGTRFAYQWLRLQDVQKVWPEPFLFPDFSQQLADAMVKETELFFNNLVHEDRPLTELFNADYSFMNERLAKFYGIDNVAGDEFRKVQYPNSDRRGVMSHASVMKLTSMSERTSPVLRGKWVMEVLMGTPPPPPPPNVPTLDATSSAGAGRRLTTRERMEQHRKNPVCTSCHSFIDPIGLALDNFDPTGRWRTRENSEPLDTRGVFYDGTAINTPSDLVNVLLKRPIPLVRNFTDNMLAYAIGRPTTFMDQPSVRAIAKASEQQGYKMSALIMGIVKSDAFQMRQSTTTTQQN